MERKFDWMSNRFANVGINSLNQELQNNGDKLFDSGVGNFDIETLADSNNSANPLGETAQVISDVHNDFDFNSLTDLNISVNQQNDRRNPEQYDLDSESFVARRIDNPNNCIGSGLDPVMNNDGDPVLNSGLDTVISSFNVIKMEVDQEHEGNCDTAQKSPDTTESLQSLKKRDQKRRPKPKDGSSLLCAICGDRALGYNFDAITCESCKAFFRRNALKTKKLPADDTSNVVCMQEKVELNYTKNQQVFVCSFEGNCKLDPHTRKFCSGCRLKKCIDAGMKKDWILSDDQLAKRRKKSRSCEEAFHIKSESFSQGPSQLYPQTTESATASQYPLQNTEMLTNTMPRQGGGSDGEVTTSYLSDSTDNSMSSPGNQPFNFSQSQVKMEPCYDDMPQPMPPDIEADIQALEKDYHSVFDIGYSELQAKKMVERPHTANELFNMTDIFIRRLIKFAKHIPDFKCLKQEDQICLLKGGIMEIMVLRSAMGFDPKKLQWKVKQQEDATTEHGLDPNIIKEQLGQGMYTNHMQFVTSLHQMTQSDSTIMTLLFVIQIFSPERPNTVSKDEITQAQEKFTMWLRVYLESIMPVMEARNLYPKLLVKLLDVRQLGESSSKLASHLDITKLEPLLIEVFNLQK